MSPTAKISCALAILLVLGLKPVSGQFLGGNSDGFSSGLSCISDLDGVSQFLPGAISGSTEFCDFSTESYSISVAGISAGTTYNWSVPAGSTIISGQGTSSVLVQFGNTAGNVEVDVSNECTTVNVQLAVTSGTCQFFAGGTNDGFTNTISCISNLDGGSQFIPGPIIGSSEFCDFSTQSYSIAVAGISAGTTYAWSVPAGATIVSGQGTDEILVEFGNTAGNVEVDVSNECTTVNVPLAVTAGTCQFFAGGSNDGFTNTISCISNLDGGSQFIPGPIMGSTEFCDFATQAYSIVVAGISAGTTYNWSVPAGATIVSGQGTDEILVEFGNTAGNVEVDVSNECTTVNVQLAVTTGTCQFFAGGANDGFSNTISCISNLDGGSQFIPGPIMGSTEFCDFASETYSIVVAGISAGTTYNWTVPAGATIVSGQGTPEVLIQFGNSGGNVEVDVSNECTTVNVQLAVASGTCQFFAGGDNDGFNNTISCISDLNGGSQFIPGPIMGSSEFCDFATETYSIVVAGISAGTTYNWTVPAGATIISGQGTSEILVQFGNSGGNVEVDVSNECSTVNVQLAVASGTCQFFAGGDNDGFTNTISCISNLDGGSQFIPGPIAGSTEFCDFATESYSIAVAGISAGTTYTWSAPAGATILSGQGTSSVLVQFGNTNGNISVDVSNECTTINVQLAVTSASCIFYAGGSSDGFSFTERVNTPLPIELVSFEAQVIDERRVKLKWSTASETNNDYFTIERSVDSKEFSPIAEVDGASNSSRRLDYEIEDEAPLPGTSYYRLRQTDFDGTTSLSRTVVVSIQPGLLGLQVVYPNPIRNQDQLNIEYSVVEQATLQIVMYDLTGKKLLHQQTDLNPGKNIFPIQLPDVKSGAYLIRFYTTDKNEVVRIKVQ